MEISKTASGKLSPDDVKKAVIDYVEKQTGKRVYVDSVKPKVAIATHEEYGTPPWDYAVFQGFDFEIEY